MKTRFFLAICLALIVLGTTAWADGPDNVVLSNISSNPASSTNGNGQGRNVTLSSNVNPGDTIHLTFVAGATTGKNSSSTRYADLVYLTSKTNVKPTGAADVSVTGLANCSFAGVATTCDESATLTAPSTPGAYQVLIDANDGRNGQGQMTPDFFFLNFTVSVPNCNPAATTLVVGTPGCTVYHAGSVLLSATLTSGSTPLVGKTVTFILPGGLTGFGYTDANGIATYNYNPSTLLVGNYPISASWQSDNACYQNPTVTGNVLGIEYLFIGFQQPINADGSSIFNGKVIPVKVKISDAAGGAVTDAYAEVHVEPGTPAIVGTDTENVASSINFDAGYVMRYDPTANQYVFNWDTSNMQLGANTIRVYFPEEATCAGAHQVVVSLGKKK